MKTKEKETISWLQINNLIPIITSLVIISLSWASLSSKLALLDQKLDFLVKTQQEYIDSRRNLETRFGELALQVKELEVLLKK